MNVCSFKLNDLTDSGNVTQKKLIVSDVTKFKFDNVVCVIVEIFSDIELDSQTGISRHANFRSFPDALLALFRYLDYLPTSC